MAYKKIYSRVTNTPTTPYPTVLSTEYQRLQAAGTVTRTIEHVTDASALLAQNIAPNKQKYLVTEVWTNESAYQSYIAWRDSTLPNADAEWKVTNQVVNTVIFEGTI